MNRPGGSGLRNSFLTSAVVHVAAIGVVWAVASSIESVPPMRVYAVDLVSPPPQQLGEPSPEPVPVVEAEEPDEEPAEEEPEPTPPAPPPPPAPAPVQAQRPPTPPPPPPPPRQQPAQTPPAQQPPAPSTGARPDPTSPGGEDLDLQLRGVQCPTPDYCNNIIRQINRYFRSPGGIAAAEADVYFVINRDGSVTNLRMVSSTGGASFRLAVLEAVEQAGINRAFGPLPQPFRADQLPVSFYFRPAR